MTLRAPFVALLELQRAKQTVKAGRRPEDDAYYEKQGGRCKFIVYIFTQECAQDNRGHDLKTDGTVQTVGLKKGTVVFVIVLFIR